MNRPIALYICILLVILAQITFSAKAQEESFHEAPSLQIGLGSLDLTKGFLDKELVLEIIADKQLEVKNQLIKNMLLNKIDGAGGTVYSYIDNVLNTLILEKSADVQVKKILESSVNMGFVYAFTNYYLYTLDPKKFANINKLAMASGCYLPPDYKTHPLPKTLDALINSYYQEQTENTNTFIEINNMVIAATLIDIAAEVVNNSHSLRTFGLTGGGNNDSYLYLNQYLNLSDCPDDFNEFTFLRKYIENGSYIEEIGKLEKSIVALNELLIEKKIDAPTLQSILEDLNYERAFLEDILNESTEIITYINPFATNTKPDSPQEKIKSNLSKTMIEDLKEVPENDHKGFVQARYEGIKFKVDVLEQSSIEAEQKVKKKVDKIRSDIGTLKSKIDNNNQLLSRYRKCYANKIYNDMTDALNSMVNNIGFIWYLNENAKNIDFKSINLTDIESLLFPQTTLDKTTFSDLVSKAKIDLTGFLNSDGMDAENYKIVSETIMYLNKLEFVDIENDKLNRNSEILYHLNKNIIPNFIKLISISPDIVDINDLLGQMSKMLAKQLFSNKTALEKFNQNQIFFSLVGKLYELDKVSTYNDYLNVLSDVGDIFPSDKVQTAINTTVSILKDYITFSEDDNKITVQIDVEACLLNLSKIKYHRHRPFKFHFTVGANTTSFTKGIGEEDEVIKSYSYVGEKIGLKYIMFDWDYTRSFHKGETFEYHGNTYTRKVPARNPTISNMHLLFYGSGILYNLANTGSTADFNSPLLGLGTGLTFFNNLDFSLSAGIPLLENSTFDESFDHLYWNLGFDIQFIEYYEKLREKQRSNKKQKQIVELRKTSTK